MQYEAECVYICFAGGRRLGISGVRSRRLRSGASLSPVVTSRHQFASAEESQASHSFGSVRFGSFHHFNSFHFRILVSPRFIERQGRKTPCRDMLCQSKTVIQNTASTFVGRDWYGGLSYIIHMVWTRINQLEGLTPDETHEDCLGTLA